MKNFVGLKAEIKKQKAIRARLDNERGRQTVNWKAATFRLALLNHWKRQEGKRPGAFLYPANVSRLYIFEVEMFYRYNH